jgi:hypothetical protein
VSSPVASGRSRPGWLLGVMGAVVLVAVIVIGVRSASEPDPSAAGSGPDDAEVEATDEDGADDDAITSAARGPDGTRRVATVPDEIPAGLVPDSARDVESTVARGGDDWSAVVVFRSTDERRELETTIDAAMQAADFTRRNAVEDAERRVIRYDGADGAVLSVTLRTEGEEQVVGVSLVSG